MNILGLIPARGGSKGIPQKNIVPLAGKPLIAHTIQAAKASRYLSRVIVSTDDQAIATVAQEWGAEVPFLRPATLANDTAPAIGVMQHAIHQLAEDGWQANLIVYLQPTSPLRTTQNIDDCIQRHQQHHAQTVVSVVAVPHHYNPISLFKVAQNGQAQDFIETEQRVLRRQDKPKLYARNGPAVLVLTAKRIMEDKILYGEQTYLYEMKHQESVDIDSPFDLAYAEWLFASGFLDESGT